jgi:hypothetical protein
MKRSFEDLTGGEDGDDENFLSANQNGQSGSIGLNRVDEIVTGHQFGFNILPSTVPEPSTDAEQTECSICMESWTISGPHRIVSIKCGHLFGKKYLL